MKKSAIKILTLWFVLTGLQTQAQLLDSTALAAKPTFTDLTESLKNPTQVYKLDLHRNKLKEIPAEVFTLVNLQELNISKNKLKNISKDIAKLTKS